MTTYAAFNYHIQDEEGQDVDGALVEVRRESDSGLATLYSDRNGAVPLSNPFVANTSTGRFHVVGGSYRITVTKDGSQVSTPWRYVAIGLLSEADTIPLPLSALNAVAFGLGQYPGLDGHAGGAPQHPRRGHLLPEGQVQV
jgi:D-serine deaminase-like pyridoxal phosphate-dependent protein